MAARVITNGASTLIRKTSSDSSVVVSRNGPIRPVMPALLTSPVNRPSSGDRLRDDRRGPIEIGEVGLQQHDPRAQLAALGGHRLGLVATFAIGQREIVPVPGQSTGDGGADASAAAGDQRGWTLVARHPARVGPRATLGCGGETPRHRSPGPRRRRRRRPHRPARAAQDRRGRSRGRGSAVPGDVPAPAPHQRGDRPLPVAAVCRVPRTRFPPRIRHDVRTVPGRDGRPDRAASTSTSAPIERRLPPGCSTGSTAAAS